MMPMEPSGIGSGSVQIGLGLKEQLGLDFRMLGEPRDVEFVIRETARKFQHSVSQLTVLEKRA